MTKIISKKKTTLWRLFDLYLGTGISFVKGLLIIPLYLNFIDSKLYGAWLATGSILMWFTLFDPGVGDVALQRIAASYASKDLKNIRFQISSSVFISLIISLVALVVGLSFSNRFIDLAVKSTQIDLLNLQIAFKYGIITTAITLFSFSLNGSLTGLQRTKITGLIRNFSGLVGIALTVYLLYKGFKLIAISLSGLIASVVATVGYLIYLLLIIKKEKIGIGFDIKFMKSYSRIFTFTFLSRISDSFTRNLDLILVSRFVGLEAVTILGLSRKPMQFIKSFAISPSIAMLPTISHLYGERDFHKLKKVIVETTALFFIIFLFISGGVIVFNESFITFWVGQKFYIGNFLNSIIAATFFFSSFSYILSNFTFSLGAIKQNSLFQFIKNLIQLIAMYIAGLLWGLNGILISILVVSLMTETWFYPKLLSSKISLRHKELKKNFIQLLILLITVSVISYFFLFVTIKNWQMFIILIVSYAFIFIIIVNLFYPDYKKLIKQIIKK